MKLLLLLLLLRQDFPKDALESIKADEAFEHVKVLASDEYEGRESGTAPNNKAAQYIADHLKKWGLKPAAPGGSYFQPFTTAGKTQNVLAWLEGSDAKLKKEYVMVGAHYDHIGLVQGGGGDRVNNGADDNASGTAAVLEVAQAYASLKNRPQRSVIFAWWSGEEKGLLGSKHFVKNPTVELKSVVAYLNLDMVGRNAADTIDIEGTGCSPDLKAVFDKVNEAKIFASIGYQTAEVKADTDHFPFYQAGVPAVEFFSGYHADYHKPGDEVDKITKEKLERTGRFVALSMWELANARTRPAFQKTK